MCALALILITGGFVSAEEFAFSAEATPNGDDLINSLSTSYGGVGAVPMSAAAALTNSLLTPDEFAVETAFTIASVQCEECEISTESYGGQETQITYSSTNVFPRISDRFIVWEEWVNGRSQIGASVIDSVSPFGSEQTSYPRTGPDTSGDYIVYAQRGGSSSTGSNSNVYVYDSATHTERAIAPFSANQYAPAISGKYVVWQDWRSGFPNIYLADLNSGSVAPISKQSSDQISPAISGTYVVWEDWRNGNADIYLYNIASGAERQLTQSASNEKNPRISGNLVVWQDDRNGESRIYALTLDNMVEAQISFGEGSQVSPDVSGGLVVWENQVNSRGNIQLLDLMQNKLYKVTDSQYDHKNPSIYGTNIVWEDYRSGSPNIYLFRASTSALPGVSSYRFYGTAQLGGIDVPPGSIVEAVIDGIVRGSFTVVSPGLVGNSYGPYLEVPVYANDFGKTIQFYVNQYLADQTVPVATPGMSQISLSAVDRGTPPIGTYTLQGTVYIDGQLAPQGTVLTAYAGTSPQATVVILDNGQYNSFIVPVYPQDMDATLSFSVVHGQSIARSTSTIIIGETVSVPYDVFCTSSPPSPPSFSPSTPVFSGTVLIDGMPAPVGTVISAFVEGSLRSQTTIAQPGQYSNLAVPITANDAAKQITFYVTYNSRQYLAAQSVTVGSGGSSGSDRDSQLMMSLSVEEDGNLVALDQTAPEPDTEFSAEALTLVDPSLSVNTPAYIRLDLTVATGGSITGFANAYSFSGFAQLDGAMLPSGSVISAYVNNELRGTATTQGLGQYTDLRVPITFGDIGKNILFTAVAAGETYQASQQIMIGTSGNLIPGSGFGGGGSGDSLIGLSVGADGFERIELTSGQGAIAALGENNLVTALSEDRTVYGKLDLSFVKVSQQVGTYRFYGLATIDGTSTPVGTQITAKIGNDVRSQTTVSTSGSYSAIDVPIYSNDFGKTIAFYATYGATTYESLQFVPIDNIVSGTKQVDLNFISRVSSTYRFYGTARIDGQEIPVHTTIYATVDGEVRGSFVVTQTGQYGSASGLKLEAPVYQSDVGKYITFATSSGAEATQTQLISGGLTVRKDLIFRAAPVQSANFEATPVRGDTPLVVSFKDKSTPSPHEWFWEFGDGGTSAEKNPSHTYTQAGLYSVRLTVSYPNNGLIRQAIKEHYISADKGPDAEAFISIVPGWNFISTPKTLAPGWDIAEKLFGSVPVAGHSVFSFNQKTNSWVPLTAKSVFKPFDPVWIYSEYATSIQLYFEPDAMRIPPAKQMMQGWSTFGVTSLSPISANNALLSVKDSWVYAIGYDAATQHYEPTIMNVPESKNNILVPGKGYWIYMSEDGVLAGSSA